MPTNAMLSKTAKNDVVLGRQIAFFAAFVLPVYKLLEVPSLLARFAGGDLLLPALLHFILQTGLLIALLYAASKSEKTLLERMNEKLGRWSLLLYGLYAVWFLFAAVLPLLDLEKFVYAVFYDTSPTIFSFALFFVFSAFLCCKGIKATGRIADLSLFLFLLPFIALLVMSLNEADVNNLLPVFQRPFNHTVSAFTYTAPHFSDLLFLMPLIVNLRFQKNDGKKIVAGYAGGALCTLVFLAVFYGVYSTIAPREHYAFSKIAQYFPVLSVVGRIDLLFVYMLCIVLFFFTATPLHYATESIAHITDAKGKILISGILNFAAFLFVLFCNKYYDAIYAFFGERFYYAFFLFSDLAPLFLLFLIPKKEKNDAEHA